MGNHAEVARYRSPLPAGRRSPARHEGAVGFRGRRHGRADDRA